MPPRAFSEEQGTEWMASRQRSAPPVTGKQVVSEKHTSPPAARGASRSVLCRRSPGRMIYGCLGCVGGGLIKKVAGR